MQQELVETLYHVLWELVHVFFEHRGLLTGRDEGAVHDAGASSFLYPFLAEGETDLDAVMGDVRASVLMKAGEVGELRRQTLEEGGEELLAAAGDAAATFDAGGRLLALGNGGSATDAMDVVADFRAPRDGWAARPAIDLTEDTAILTAIANDIGVDAIFQRQVIAYGRADDALLALSTSGNSVNVIDALVEARRRRMHTIAMRRIRRRSHRRRGDCRPRDRDSLPAHPAHPGGAGERLPRAAGARRGRLMSIAPAAGVRRIRVRVEGIVQGVGFRPYVFRLATELGLGGFVLNDEHGVLLEVEGEPETLERFTARLPREVPPLAIVESIDVAPVEVRSQAGFAIVTSARGGDPDAPVSPDSATCDECLAELFDPGNRRFRYPFLNCTNCGPRFTIVRGVPYDRPLTTMAGFEMCTACRAEYDDPRDRRFHAQPNACSACGPAVRLVDRDGRPVDRGARDDVEAAAGALRDGLIVAVKGIGGFHLACRADSERAVATLRARKHREDKPFAVMARD